ncbi:conserved hypothetical protein [Candida albicans WO-1]|uniref:Rhodanese domain-containing protein n=1 Tax=Candida albicans (strain WO-1) TaxID=294748 RepID=C4YI16_CANAW|nr:conserved hypothetical protein [Candida albicans WO-1]
MSKIYSLSDLKFIKPKTLKSWFTNGSSPHGKFCVVDVRDSDFVGGHIKGCYHYPAANFHYTLNELYQKIYQNKIQDIVFYCALSQVRGPSSTLKFLRGIDDITDSKVKSYFNDDNIRVYVYTGASQNGKKNMGTIKK